MLLRVLLRLDRLLLRLLQHARKRRQHGHRHWKQPVRPLPLRKCCAVAAVAATLAAVASAAHAAAAHTALAAHTAIAAPLALVAALATAAAAELYLYDARHKHPMCGGHTSH